MKANFVCLKLSKPVIILLIVITIQIIFILIGVIEIREASSFEDIHTNIENDITQNVLHKEVNIINNTQENAIIKEVEKKREEYKNMPSELKGYKIVRENYNS